MTGLSSLFTNSPFAVFLAMFLGVLLGQLDVRGVELGISGVLFAGLALGAVGFTVDHAYFTLALVLFIAAVGLLASRDIADVLRANGIKFLLTAIIMTAVAAGVTTLFLIGIGRDPNPWLIRGTFAGAITSSPSLAATLEITPGASQQAVTTGYSVAYPVGVVVVILFAQFAPQLSHVNMAAERRQYSETMGLNVDKSEEAVSIPFSLAGFALAIVLGALLGLVPIPLGPLGTMTLDITGGTLITALGIGYLKHVGPINTQMSTTVLTQIREVSIGIFLAVVGIEASAGFITTVPVHGGMLFGVALLTAGSTLLSGYVLTVLLWDLNWISALGAITGGMTSTPGLGAAIHATETEDVGASYGAIYPFALVAKVVFAKLLVLLV